MLFVVLIVKLSGLTYSVSVCYIFSFEHVLQSTGENGECQLGFITLVKGNFQSHLFVVGDGHLMLTDAALENEFQPV